jgi:hypothetical protein
MTKPFCQQKSFGKNPEKQQACETAWGIGNGEALLSALKKTIQPTKTFCIQGLDAIGSSGKKIPAPAVFSDCAAKAFVRQRSISADNPFGYFWGQK